MKKIALLLLAMAMVATVHFACQARPAPVPPGSESNVPQKVESERSKDYVEKACDLWVMLRSNPDKYLHQDITVELKVDYMNSERGYFSSYPGKFAYYNEKYSKTLPAGIWPHGVEFSVNVRYSEPGIAEEFFKIKKEDRIKVTAEFMRLADDGAVLMHSIKQLVNEGWKPEG